MPLVIKPKAGDFKQLRPGSHISICDMVVDLGLQPGSGMYPDPKHQIYIRFEVPAERVDYEKEGKKVSGPVVIGNKYTASMHKKANLRLQLENWRGRAFTEEEAGNFDIATILGKPCMLSVVEKESGGKLYSNIKAISGLPTGVPSPKAENPLLFYSPGEPNACKLTDLPEWLVKLIQNPAKQEQSHATGVYAEQEPVWDYSDQPYQATDEDIDCVPF